jgi:hypothetical protein
VPVQQPVQYGRDAAHISWAAWEQIPLEDCMEERQHHLTESSSARLRRSQKLEILPSPNSKSLGAYFWAHTFFIRREDFNGHLVTIVYYEARTFWMWRIYFIYAQIF